MPTGPSDSALGSSEEIEIAYLDDHLLAAVKPAGLLSVPGRGPENADCLSTRLQQFYPDALIVHRLDMATSGLILFARSVSVQRLLGLAFQTRSISKRYIAVVHGNLQAQPVDGHGWGLIDLPIGADWNSRPRRQIDKHAGKPSQTRWQPTGYDATSDTTTLMLDPLTGRTHQLRVHLQAIGHPIVGDALYGWPTDKASRLLLHATELRLDHPIQGVALTVRSPAPFQRQI